MTTRKKAKTKIAKHVGEIKDFFGQASLYKLSAPVTYDDGAKRTRHVVICTTKAMLDGPETLVYPADRTGNVKDWEELDGSQKGIIDHAKVLERVLA